MQALSEEHTVRGHSVSWFRVDDVFPGHQKLDSLLDDPDRWCRALAVWLVCGCYAARYNTDGKCNALRVTRECAAGVNVDAAFDDLVSCGLLVRVTDGHVMHDFLDYNPTSAEVDQKRKANADRQKRFRNKARNADGNAVTGALRNADGNALRNALVTRQRNAPVTPSRPDPTRPLKTTSTEDKSSWSADWPETGKQLAARRKRLPKLKMAALGHAIMPSGLPRGQILRWERGEETPEPAVLTAWIACLERWEAKTKPTNPDHQLFVRWFTHEWQVFHRVECEPDWSGRDHRAVSALLARHGPDETRMRAVRMFKSAGTWPVANAADATLATLAQHFDRFVTSRAVPAAPVQPGRAPSVGGAIGRSRTHGAILDEQDSRRRGK